MEGDVPGIGGSMLVSKDFYPRPHMEGDFACSNSSFARAYFYPRPHMEGDLTGSAIPITPYISTHALTWRATSVCDRVHVLYLLFLPTPSHGGRPTAISRPQPGAGNFYPRPHMEGDIFEDAHERGF